MQDVSSHNQVMTFDVGSPQNALLKVQSLEVSFSGFKAVNGLDLTINRGEVRVLIGANGTGKTTTMDLISGKTKATAGKILFKNELPLLNKMFSLLVKHPINL